MSYRVNRNITASLLQFIEAQLVIDEWDGITVLKGMSKAYDTTPPIITIRCSDSEHKPFEIGDNATVRETLVFIDIFGSDSGQGFVEDLKDWLVEILKDGVDYYLYNNGVKIAEEADGRINILSIKDSPINFGVTKSTLDIRDRYRWLITLSVETGKIET